MADTQLECFKRKLQEWEETRISIKVEWMNILGNKGHCDGPFKSADTRILDVKGEILQIIKVTLKQDLKVKEPFTIHKENRSMVRDLQEAECWYKTRYEVEAMECQFSTCDWWVFIQFWTIWKDGPNIFSIFAFHIVLLKCRQTGWWLFMPLILAFRV